MTLTVERLRTVLLYDPVSGIFRWRLARKHLIGKVAGRVTKEGYRQIKIDQRQHSAHRLAWLYVHGEWPQYGLDHRDTIKDHNWIDNLRPATTSQNAANCVSRAWHGVKGVTLLKTGKWQASIKKDGRSHYLGLFDTPEAANEAYRKKAVELQGSFARAA